MLKKLHFIIYCFIILIIKNSIAEDALLQIENTAIYKAEFENIYNKNNINNKADYSKKSLQEYIDLYTNFRLKIKYAQEIGLDTNAIFKEELDMYATQLLENYTTKNILENTVSQELERAKEDVQLAHIFYFKKEDANNKINDIYKNIKNGTTTFENAALQSEDTNNNKNGGNLGWYNSYQITIPEIENVAYNLKVGEISSPIETRIGFHIIKLIAKRPAKNNIKVAIIKKYLPFDTTNIVANKLVKDTIDFIYSKLLKREDFNKFVQQYSEDEASKLNNGELDFFGINKYDKTFEETAFDLVNNEISLPIKTKTAWYIIKKIADEKPLTKEEKITFLKNKLQNSNQYEYEFAKKIEDLKTKYNVKVEENSIANFKRKIQLLSQKTPFTYTDTSNATILFSINNNNINENFIGKIIQDNFYKVYPKKGIDKFDFLINNAIENIVLETYKTDIKNNNNEYKNLIEEYKNGMLIFELSEKNIWQKANSDSVELNQFFDNNRNLFIAPTQATQKIIPLKNKKQANLIAKYLSETKEIDHQQMYNLGFDTTNIITKNIVETNTQKLQEGIVVSKIKKKYQATKTYNLQPKRPMEMQECKGFVLSAYQDFLEKKFITKLKNKYKVILNQEILDSMVKKP